MYYTLILFFAVVIHTIFSNICLIKLILIYGKVGRENTYFSFEEKIKIIIESWYYSFYHKVHINNSYWILKKLLLIIFFFFLVVVGYFIKLMSSCYVNG